MASTSSPAVFLSGKLVYLRPPEREDVPQFVAWANDPELRYLTGMVTPTSLAEKLARFDKPSDDPTRVWLSVVRKEDHRLIGETGLLRMFPAWRTTDMTIILGDKECWRKGYGSETMTLMLDYAFGYQNMHRVAIGVVGSNTRALRFYEKMGFVREGVQRDGYYHDHAYQDFVMMSILEDEFRAQR